MNVDGKHYRTIWLKANDDAVVQVIDQRDLPHRFVIEDLKTVDDFCAAIKDMHVRGAGLIGAAAAYGMYIAALEGGMDHVVRSGEKLKATRPTAKDLEWAVKKQMLAMNRGATMNERTAIAKQTAIDIADEYVECGRMIGEHGLPIIERISERKKDKKVKTVNILTHCNAGWLAFVDYGSATAPIYAAYDKGIDLHVWVDMTGPRNQGGRLTAWELGKHGVPHTVIPDNTGGKLMQDGLVDMCIVGTDRTTYTGDVANKIGTLQKAAVAWYYTIPFYVALPSSTIDWEMRDGVKEIPIEKRDDEEVRYARGYCDGEIKQVLLTPEDSPVANYAFDVTPRDMIMGLITERGVCEASEKGILGLFPEKRK
ncbi:S-methyl-5-thioribose-1-phosphate isomerase [Nanoarchaeota archaeon]